MLEIRVLGPLRVVLDGRPLAIGHGRRARELLGWLALHSGLHARSRVAADFWPDVPNATARNNLRQIAWDLRRALGSAADRIEGDRDSIGLSSSPDVWVDAWAFDAAATARRWAEAAGLATGHVLEGLDAEWLDDVRDLHRRRLAEVLTALATAQATAGDPSGAAATTRRLLDLDLHQPDRLLARRRPQLLHGLVEDAFHDIARHGTQLSAGPGPALLTLSRRR